MDKCKKSNIDHLTFCELLPKIELHAHLNGSLNEELLKKLGCDDNSISEYQKLTKILNKTSRTLEECFRLFDVAYKATQTKEKLYLATKSVIEDFNKENTLYLEIRTTPRCEENMSKEEYIETVIQAINDCKKSCKTLVKLILSINRKHDDISSQESMDIIIALSKKYPNIIKGVELSGNPEVGSFDEKLFEKARKSGLKVSIHCAEVKNDEEVKRILEFQPDRLGHAVFLHPDSNGSEENWRLYLEKRIPIECCLTSNVVCGTVKQYEEHHIREWLNLKLPFSICTDDKGVFCTTLSKEYELVMQHFKMSPEEIYKCTVNTIDQTFASDEEKKHLKEELIKWHSEQSDIFKSV